MDAAGVFELAPPVSPSGAWTESELFTYHGPPEDSGPPQYGLVAGPKGSLYGATFHGGTYDQGAVVELKRPAPGGSWTTSVIYSFHGDGDGTNPEGGLVVDSKGTIYGSTNSGGLYGCGTVFQLKRVHGAWREKIIYSLDSGAGNPQEANPFGNLILGENGTLYGQGGFGIFQLTPPQRLAAPGLHSPCIKAPFPCSASGSL
jgi:hypothetical protein